MRNFMGGEMENVGSVIRRCLEASERQFYRPNRPFKHRRKKLAKPESGQLSFKFSETPRDSERPLIDLIPEAYQ